MAVENGTKFPNARKLLELNRVWLQRETVEWTDYQVANDISPFTTAFTYEETKCERDVGYIVDAIVYDLCHGGNVKSRESALRYVNEPGQFYIKGQEEETVASLAYALTIMGNVLAQTDPSVSYQTTNGDNSTAIVSQYKNTAVTAEPTALTRVTELLKIITDAITAGNDTGIPARDIRSDQEVARIRDEQTEAAEKQAAKEEQMMKEENDNLEQLDTSKPLIKIDTEEKDNVELSVDDDFSEKPSISFNKENSVLDGNDELHTEEFYDGILKIEDSNVDFDILVDCRLHQLIN